MNPLKRFFQEDLAAAFSAGKWRIDLMQLKTRHTQLEKRKLALLGELGTKAWNAKLKNEGFGTIYGKLEGLDGQVGLTQKEIDAVQDKINLETRQLNTLNAEFDARMKDAQNQRQGTLQKINQLQLLQKEIEQRISQFQRTITQGNANLQTLENQISQIQASGQADKQEKIASMENTRSSVEMQIGTAGSQLTSAKTELDNNQAEQLPLKNEMDRHGQLIAMLQEQNKTSQTPIREKLRALNQELIKFNEKKAGLLNQVSALMPEFGGEVFRVRPPSDSLTAEYTNLDAISGEIKGLADQINLTQARLSSINSGSIQKVALFGGGLVFILFFLVIMGVWVVPTALKLLTPDPKSSIKLVESWQLTGCELSAGVYDDLSVWENKRDAAAADVQIESRLIGANDIILDSDTTNLMIAPGGMAVSMVSLNAGGSRVEKIERSVGSVEFYEITEKIRNSYDINTYFEKVENSNNITLGMEIVNKGDFGLTQTGGGVALVINEQKQVIDLLLAYIETGTIEIDSSAKVKFISGSGYDTSSCFQDDYSQEKVSFWYFIPFETTIDSNTSFTISGKAEYTP